MKTHIIKPLITEKTMHISSGGWYTFKADITANKKTVRNEIEKLYTVSVVIIRSVQMHGKVLRVGRKGKKAVRSNWKKFFVKLKKGQTIDAFQIGGQEDKK